MSNNFIVNKTIINANVPMTINGTITVLKDIYFNNNNISLSIQLATLQKQIAVLNVEYLQLSNKYNNLLLSLTTQINEHQQEIVKLNHTLSNANSLLSNFVNVKINKN